MPTGVSLAEARACLEGVLPAVVATCAPDGTPNVTYLSKVRYIDAEHVALSNQFFTKTVQNVRRNPQAQITLMDPGCGRHYRFDVVFVRSEEAGELFEQMRAEIEAIASLMGMQDVFRLRAVDVYRVLHGAAVPSDLDG